MVLPVRTFRYSRFQNTEYGIFFSSFRSVPRHTPYCTHKFCHRDRASDRAQVLSMRDPVVSSRRAWLRTKRKRRHGPSSPVYPPKSNTDNILFHAPRRYECTQTTGSHSHTRTHPADMVLKTDERMCTVFGFIFGSSTRHIERHRTGVYTPVVILFFFVSRSVHVSFVTLLLLLELYLPFFAR